MFVIPLSMSEDRIEFRSIAGDLLTSPPAPRPFTPGLLKIEQLGEKDDKEKEKRLVVE